MKATYTFSVMGMTYPTVLLAAKKEASSYWDATPHKIVSIDADGDMAIVTTQALEAVAS